MNRSTPKISRHLRWVLLVSLTEIPFLVAGGLMFALGGDELQMIGVAVVAMTAVSGSAVIALGMRSAGKPDR